MGDAQDKWDPAFEVYNFEGIGPSGMDCGNPDSVMRGFPTAISIRQRSNHQGTASHRLDGAQIPLSKREGTRQKMSAWMSSSFYDKQRL